MLILSSPSKAEFQVKNSKFLSEIGYVATPEEARKIWHERKRLYSNGGHIVYAFIIGPQGNILSCSDDGEPSGTAGRPVLEVLKGSGITNILLTVARWFGGTELGTGGLVKAYTTCAQLVLANAVTKKFIQTKQIEVETEYSYFDSLKHHLTALNVKIEKIRYCDKITFTILFDISTEQIILSIIQDITNGSARIFNK